MSSVVAWCGFVGAWLLFAGPVYQASLELREQDAVTDEVQQAIQVVATPPPVSAWWWLLPPVRFLLESRRWKGRRQAMMSTLTAAQRKKVVQYLNKTTGWLFVAFGGFLIAVKETWELCERHDWPIWVFVLLVVAAAALCLAYTAARMAESDRVVAADERSALLQEDQQRAGR